MAKSEGAGAISTGSPWRVEGLRVTGFLGPSALPLAEPAWWKALLGDAPETRTAEPRRGFIVEAGAFGPGILTLQVQPPLRVDWSLAGPVQTVPEPGFNLMGHLAEVATPLVDLMGRWTEIAPPLNRLAFGAILLQPVETRQAAHEILRPYLQKWVTLDSARSSDFSYQINRPRPSTGLPNMPINRLSKWAAGSTRAVSLTMTPQGVSYGLGQESFAARLELDVSTPAESEQDLPKSALAKLLDELVSLGLEIAEKGDIE